jgi:G3E family GTPase
MSEINIDVDLIEKGGSNLSRTEEKLVEMTNGCICCTLRDDLLQEVEVLAAQNKYDYLLIESTGIAEPLPVAATFYFRDEDGKSLSAEMDKGAIKANLDKCLVRDFLINKNDQVNSNDPFPKWFEQAA